MELVDEGGVGVGVGVDPPSDPPPPEQAVTNKAPEHAIARQDVNPEKFSFTGLFLHQLDQCLKVKLRSFPQKR